MPSPRKKKEKKETASLKDISLYQLKYILFFFPHDEILFNLIICIVHSSPPETSLFNKSEDNLME